MRQRGFALLDVLLAVVLMSVAAAASYTLIKSFRVNSATQQLIRYATNITQGFTPFLDGGAATSSGVLNGDKLLASFLSTINVPSTDQVNSDGSACTDATCYVDSSMYVEGKKSVMNFAISTDTTYRLSSYFIISVKATGAQVNQVLQSSSSLFSIYCAQGTVALTKASACSLQSKDDATKSYSLFLIFPKSGSAIITPDNTSFAPVG